MTESVYKYPLQIQEGIQTILLPSEAKSLSVQMVNDQPCLYAIVYSGNDAAQAVERKFLSVLTGQSVNVEFGLALRGIYLGTVVIHGLPVDPFVVHYFEIM